MKLLLDTHTLLWWLADDPTLSRAAREAISKGENQVFLSAASVWEIAIKQAIGKLDIPGELIGALEEGGFEPLPIAWAHALRAGSLPRHHDDPFDRMLIAQAQAEEMVLVSRDERFRHYEVAILPA
ncbi:MAG TPA: type II toxin-antitoxin system VapC family toxin [Pantanalinema sp.]